MQEVLPIMHTQLGAPATVLAKSAQVRTGELLISALIATLSSIGACGQGWAAVEAVACVSTIEYVILMAFQDHLLT